MLRQKSTKVAPKKTPASAGVFASALRSVPTHPGAHTDRQRAHGAEEVRRQNTAIGVVAVPGELIEDVLGISLHVPVVV